MVFIFLILKTINHGFRWEGVHYVCIDKGETFYITKHMLMVRVMTIRGKHSAYRIMYII